MNSIDHNAINHLQDFQLTKLLLKLLFLEHKKYNFENCYISVPQNINVADGGEDGRIETTDYKKSMWVTDNLCLYQCKASDMPKGKCKEELLDTKGNFKPKVKEILDNNGTYILVTTQSIVEKSLDNYSDRVASIREGIKEGKIKEGLTEVDAKVFSKNAKIKIYDANLISNWTNQYISAISYVQICNGYTKPNGLLIWDELKTYKENQEDFKSSPELEDIISKLRNDIYKGKHIRIQGPSGIGKSRLICEIMSPGGKNDNGQYDLARKTISENSIFFDISNNNSDLLNFVRSHALDTQAIVVLDNCPPDIHLLFSKECKRVGSNLQLISIDFDRVNKSQSNGDEILDLKSDYYIKVTEDILKEKYQGELSDSDIEFLIKFSEGNTKMAIDFANASVKRINLNEAFNNDLVKKIIFGREPSDNDEFKILKLLSVFDTVEFPSDEYFHIDENHYKQLLEGINFLSSFFRIEFEKFRLTIKKFIDKGTIERRGNLIMIRPNPLALKLSLLFWGDLSPVLYSKFISDIPESLRIPLSDQLQQIGGVDKAKELVKTIWGLNGNFSTAEILNSNMGSRLFRSIVTVNPEETTKVLVKNYLNKPTEYLSEVIEGRQNLVWALEKLCFRKETFPDASKVLMSFAVAEIETYYSNNSTSYFKQLFHIYLAGTEVDYNERIKTLQWALEKNNPDFDIMTLKACSSALSGMSSNTRMIGAENQGSEIPLKDYRPKNLSEVNDYTNSILLILRKLYCRYQDNINGIIRSSLYFFIESSYDFNLLREFFENMVEDSKSRHELRKSLLNIKSFRIQYDTQIEVTNEFISKTEPQTIEEEIKDKVSNPQYIYSKDINKDITKENCEAFAEKVFNERIDLSLYLKNLFIGEQHQTYNFGKKYGELKGFEVTLLDEILMFLIDLRDDDNWNISFLNGYLSEFSSEIRKSVFYKFLSKKSKFSFHLFRNINANLKDALKLLELLNIDNIKYLRFAGHELSSLNIGEFITFLDNLNPLLENKSPFLDLIHNYLRSHKSTMERVAIFEWLNGLMKKHNLLENVNKSSHRDDYDWQKTMEIMLCTNHIYVSIISEQIISYNKSNFTSLISDNHITKVAILTLEKNFDLAWNNYSKLLFEVPNYLLFSKIFNLGFSSNRNTHPLFSDKERNNKILNWCKLHPEIAKRIIRYTPLFSDSGEWFDFTFKMIIQFGNREEFLNELSSNFHSMTTVGSRVPYLESRKKLLEKLRHLSINELTNWIEKQIEYFNKQIEIEKITDAQEGLS